MIQEDKLKYIESIEKSLTSECHKLCFSKKKFLLDFECVSTCYHKYLYAINEIKNLVETEGRLHGSTYVAQSLGEEKRDRFVEEVFPLGGHPLQTEGMPIRRKFFEAYHYQDPLKTGR